MNFIQQQYGQTSSSLQTDRKFTLYRPHPTKQILLYDMATSTSVLTFLKMNQYDVSIRNQPNVEYMSENGRLPVVIEQGQDKPMCGFKEVFWHIARTTDYVPSVLELTYMDWIETKFLEAEMYICWCCESILNDYTKNRFTYDLPWPISDILYKNKRNQIQEAVGRRFTDWTDFSDKFKSFLDQVSRLIGSKPFCPNTTSPSAINALVCGHASTILDIDLHPKIVEAIKWHKKIENFSKLIEEHYLS